MENKIIYLIGFPGVGKYTIACALREKIGNCSLVDNHLINNPVFSLIDMNKPIPERAWENIGRIWKAVIDTVIHLSPEHQNFILTNVLLDSNSDDYMHYDRLKQMAMARGADFIPIRLSCDLHEHKKRIVDEDRQVRFKDINPQSPAEYSKNEKLINIQHENLLDLDVTALSASGAADKILVHIKSKDNQ